ncbi:hypothetical protein P7I84_22420 [Pseudomonas aeruginosa]|nr:hypothetical protein [Pseudomonas aeruginosa]EIU3913117.1 hypothetical protein [Pseudomonas aeruginosa]WGW42429.1 hypothetical protein P7I84_22420 [Pseudomonas aeruginosa]
MPAGRCASRRCRGVLRLTPHYLTDDGEIERLGEALEDCLRQRVAS